MPPGMPCPRKPPICGTIKIISLKLSGSLLLLLLLWLQLRWLMTATTCGWNYDYLWLWLRLLVTVTTCNFDCLRLRMWLFATATTGDCGCHYLWQRRLILVGTLGKSWGDIEQNQNTLCACWFSKGRISNISGWSWLCPKKLWLLKWNLRECCGVSWNKSKDDMCIQVIKSVYPKYLKTVMSINLLLSGPPLLPQLLMGIQLWLVAWLWLLAIAITCDSDCDCLLMRLLLLVEDFCLRAYTNVRKPFASCALYWKQNMLQTFFYMFSLPRKPRNYS